MKLTPFLDRKQRNLRVQTSNPQTNNKKKLYQSNTKSSSSVKDSKNESQNVKTSCSSINFKLIDKKSSEYINFFPENRNHSKSKDFFRNNPTRNDLRIDARRTSSKSQKYQYIAFEKENVALKGQALKLQFQGLKQKKIMIKKTLTLKDEIKCQQLISDQKLQANCKIPSFSTKKIFDSKKLEISNQFTFSINLLKQKPNRRWKQAEVQYSFLNDEDYIYFSEFKKYQQMKNQFYKKMQQMEQKMTSLMSETTQFKKDYNQLISSLQQAPLNNRQQRIFALSKSVQKAQFQVKQDIQRLEKMNLEFINNIEQKIPLVKEKKKRVQDSIHNLISVLIFNFEKDKLINNKTVKGILSRILKQISYLFKIHDCQDQYNKLTLIKSNKIVIDLKNSFKTWTCLLYENRVLLYNFMRHIQNLPIIMTEMFGFGSQDARKKDGVKMIEEKSEFRELRVSLNECIETKCQQCLGMKMKVRYLQAYNKKMKPIFKSLEWLIRDLNKKRYCLQML